MVAEPFVEAGHQRRLDGHGEGHRAAGDLGGEGHVQLVELVVELLDLVGHQGAIGIGVGSGVPHLTRHLTHLLDEPARPR